MTVGTGQHLSAAAILNEDFQRSLALWNGERLAPAFPREDFDDDGAMLRREHAMMALLRAEVAERAAACPDDPAGFLVWFEALKERGPGQGDALFPWLADDATLPQIRWFFEQEAAGEAGFDDLVALTQVRMPVRAKLELARNYWDEMGRGNEKGMHGPMLGQLGRALGARPRVETTVWQSLMLANAMTAMATRRDYIWLSVGALGIIELTAPGRAACVAQGLRRLGLNGRDRHYFDLHAVLDVRHSEAWNEEAIGPLVAEDPRRARLIAEGALIRLYCGALCFDRYRAVLWADDAAANGFARAA